MKSYVFTKREIEILKTFLDGGVKLGGFRDIKYRISKHHERIQKHYELMIEILDKLQTVT